MYIGTNYTRGSAEWDAGNGGGGLCILWGTRMCLCCMGGVDIGMALRTSSHLWRSRAIR